MSTPNILRNNSVQNAQPPYSNSQVSETAVHREILNIYQRARPETTYFYDKGRDIQGLEEENWVIRWLLWHVFRYRDNRNKNRRQASPDRRSRSSSENSGSEGPPHGAGGILHVFKKHLHALISVVGSSGRSSGASSANLSGKSSIGFYDPVRNTRAVV